MSYPPAPWDVYTYVRTYVRRGADTFEVTTLSNSLMAISGSQCVLVALIPLTVGVGLYRKEPKELLKWLFLCFLVVGGLIAGRYALFKLRRWFARTRKAEYMGPIVTDLSLKKEAAWKLAQLTSDQKAEEHERTVAAPRKEAKLKAVEEKMLFIKGYKGVGHTIGREGKVSSLKTSSEEVLVDHGASPNEGELVVIALRTPSGISRHKFRTLDKIKRLYEWISELGYSSQDYCLATPLPKQLLVEQTNTLLQYGISRDTMLIIEERE